MAVPIGAFCEANLNAIIKQPANAWSNLFYVFVGVWLIYQTRSKTGLIKLLGPIAILIGFSSFIYHATWTLFGEFIDLGSMLVLTSFLISWNIKRLTKRTIWVSFVLISSASLFILYMTGVYSHGYEWGKYIFGFETVALLALEYKIYQKPHQSYRLHNLFIAFGTLLVAWFIWYLDRAMIWCDPATAHVINGHVIWHLLTSIAFIYLYRFYQQLEPYNKTNGSGTF